MDIFRNFFRTGKILLKNPSSNMLLKTVLFNAKDSHSRPDNQLYYINVLRRKWWKLFFRILGKARKTCLNFIICASVEWEWIVKIIGHFPSFLESGKTGYQNLYFFIICGLDRGDRICLRMVPIFFKPGNSPKTSHYCLFFFTFGRF